MPRQEDRRVRLTKRVIRESLIELMAQHPISKISVKMLCENADINRSTFYAHYKDPYDVLKSIQQDVVSEIKAQTFSAQFFDNEPKALPILIYLLEYCRTNATVINVLLSEHGDHSFQNELMEVTHEKILEELQGNITLTPDMVNYLKYFIIGGFVSMTKHWLDNQCSDSPEKIATLMMNLIIRGLYGLAG